jgi:hypothetical protein
MAQQSWVNLLNAGPPWQSAQGTLLNTAATATISPQGGGGSGADFVLPGQPNGLQWYVGMQLRMRARGLVTTGSTTSTLTVFPAVGVAGTLATVLCSTAGIVLGTGSLSALSWRLEADTTCTNLGLAGQSVLISDGLFELNTAAGTGAALGTANVTMFPMAFTTVSSGFSTFTPATAIGLRATLSAAFGSIQCNRFTVEQVS